MNEVKVGLMPLAQMLNHNFLGRIGRRNGLLMRPDMAYWVEPHMLLKYSDNYSLILQTEKQFKFKQ